MISCQALLAAALLSAPGLPPSPTDSVIAELLKLEQQREPKCYATASRLEDFMFGTPLSKEARFAKNLLQKRWVEWIWRQAAERAAAAQRELIAAEDIEAVIATLMTLGMTEQGHHRVDFKGREVTVHATDKRQYGSVAYSLRAVLAVQQELLLEDTDIALLSEPAVARLADALDYLTLAALKLTDERMRIENSREVERAPLVETWLALSGQPADYEASPEVTPPERADLQLLRAMIQQKLASYAAYNKVSQQLFMRNLQVYFARSRWPEDASVAETFSTAYTESMVAFTRDLYLGAEAKALGRGAAVIQERDVAYFSEDFIPHRINEYEDAIFFPRLPRSEQVEIEAFDMDAFRDPGWHWRYLEATANAPDFAPRLQLDPFAAELLTENVAQFGVLILRVAGEHARAAGSETLSVEHLGSAFDSIQQRIRRHADAEATPTEVAAIVSAGGQTPHARFVEIASEAGIAYEHRNSDWLGRQLRSYLKRDENTGIASIPPAFGGSGVAAEDVDNDGRPDILILGGRGAKLYRNLGEGRFEDVTERAGIDWRREDSTLPGEMRQPLIADLDNDGLQDIVITYVDDAHRVYRNQGDLRFEDVTERAGLGGKGLVGGPATVFDYDGDGRLDLYIQYFGDYLNGVLPTLARRNFNALPDRLFRNVGDFRFEDVTERAGVGDTGWGQSASHTDLNGDGLQDIISGNDFGINRYYLNQGDGRFREAAAELGTDKPSYTMSIGIADLNRDLTPDIYISNIVTMNKDETYVMPNRDMAAKFNPDKLAAMRVVEANDLFLSGRREGELRFELSDAVGRGRSSTGWAWDADFFDADNDGDDDLYVLNGMNEYNVYSRDNPYYTDPIENRRQDVEFPDAGKAANVYFENVGGRLENASEGSGLDVVSNSRSAAYLDVDGDGRLDIIVNDYYGPARLFHNRGESAEGWLGLRLVGAPERGVNRDAIGARVIARAGDLQVFREVRGSEGYMSVHPKTLHFGVADQQRVDLEIRWPNGRVQKVQGLAAGTVHTLTYPAETETTAP